MLLAVARISGETAPLLFTALNNQFWSTDMNAPMANLPVVIFQFAMSPYEDWQELAWAGALLITLAVLVLNIVARTLVPPERRPSELMESVSAMNLEAVATRAEPSARGRRRVCAEPKMSIRNLDFFYGKFQALKDINLDIAGATRHRVHRPVGLRQVDAAAHVEPHVFALSRPARDRRDHVQRPQHSRLAASTSTCCAPRSAWCSRSRRRFRCRSTTTSRSACACTRT